MPSYLDLHVAAERGAASVDTLASGKKRGGGQKVDVVKVQSSVGLLELIPDPRRATGRTLLIDGLTHGYVDLQDPTHLEIDYVQRIGTALGVLLPAGQASNVLHVGGGAFSLCRFIASTRPKSTQVVLEKSTAVINLAQKHLKLRTGEHLQVVAGDAAKQITTLPNQHFDLVVGDAFVGTETPPQLAGDQFAQQIKRVLKTDGVYLMNIVDQPPWTFINEYQRMLRQHFDHQLRFGHRQVVGGKHAGNVMVVAAACPLPKAKLRSLLAGGPNPSVVVG